MAVAIGSIATDLRQRCSASVGSGHPEDFFENGAVPLHIVDADGTILRANRAELDLLGYKPAEYIGRSITDFRADKPVINDILARLSSAYRPDVN